MINALCCRLPLYSLYRWWLFFILLSGGECYEYKWFSSLNSTRPLIWCQRSDGLNVTGKKLLGVHYILVDFAPDQLIWWEHKPPTHIFHQWLATWVWDPNKGQNAFLPVSNRLYPDVCLFFFLVNYWVILLFWVSVMIIFSIEWICWLFLNKLVWSINSETCSSSKLSKAHIHIFKLLLLSEQQYKNIAFEMTIYKYSHLRPHGFLAFCLKNYWKWFQINFMFTK